MNNCQNAYGDFLAAETLLKSPQDDPYYINAIAFHLARAVEKTLTAFLESAGVPVRTHDIDRLVRMSKEYGSPVLITRWIEDRADTLTRWGTDTRYDLDYFVEKEKVAVGYKEIGHFLEINGGKKIKNRDCTGK